MASISGRQELSGRVSQWEVDIALGGGSGLLPDRSAGEDVAALVDEGPVGGDVDVGRMLPVGVVDEEEAAGF